MENKEILLPKRKTFTTSLTVDLDIDTEWGALANESKMSRRTFVEGCKRLFVLNETFRHSVRVYQQTGNWDHLNK